MTICIVDTSAFCNVLDIPGKNQKREEARHAVREFINEGANLLLPLAAVYETGRHIAHLTSGGERRKAAERFVQQVQLAVNGEAPWVPTPMPSVEDLSKWIAGFPDAATRTQTLADLSIIELWHQECKRHPARRVLVWSYDVADLGGYDRQP